MGVIFFILNASFALILLLMLLVSSGFALFTKNPDTRYQPMRDDRGSFIKSQTQLTTELDALGATARGEGKGAHPYSQSRSRIDDDDDYSSEEQQRQLAVEKNGFGEHYQPVAPRSQGNDGSISPAATSFYDRRSPAPSYNQPSNDTQHRQANNASPWQRGAGYEH